MDVTGVGWQTTHGIYSLGQVQASQHQPGDLVGMTQRLIQDNDEDGNGTLNALEICISDEAFQKADANSDGELDSNELMSSAKEIGRELGPPPGMPPLGSEDDDDDDDEDDETSQLQMLLDLLKQEDEGVMQTAMNTIL